VEGDVTNLFAARQVCSRRQAGVVQRNRMPPVALSSPRLFIVASTGTTILIKLFLFFQSVSFLAIINDFHSCFGTHQSKSIFFFANFKFVTLFF
jgi:hypothetical protein